MSNPVYLSGAAMTAFGRSEKSLQGMIVEAGQGAMAAAGLEAVDAVYLGVMSSEEFTGDSNLAAVVTDQLGLPGVPSSRVETASSTGASALEVAFYAVASGYLENVLVVAGEKMTHMSTAQATSILAKVIDKVERQYGATMPALAAMIARRYAYEHKLDEDELAQALGAVAIKNHAGGVLNPYAQFQKDITLEKYLASRMVAEPLRIYDCAPMTDGAAAVLLTSQPSKICLAGIGHATDTLAVGRRGSLTSFNSTKKAALKAYTMAQLGPKDIDLAEVHDAFTIFEIIGSEDLGFFEPGSGWKAAMAGDTGRKGVLPINASGGLKARGHPVGASGLAQIVELAWQMTRKVTRPRQLDRVNVGLAQSIGGLANNNLVTILKRTDESKAWQVDFSPDYQPTFSHSHPFVKPESLKLGKGKLATWTVLHSPPEGFEPPLHLGYVRLADGAMIMAHGRVDLPLPVGSTVTVDVEGEYFLYKPRDAAAVFLKQVKDLSGIVWSWWDTVTDAATHAMRMRKAATLRERRRKRDRAKKDFEE